jgi:predicted nicotinamide N-methyase
VKVTDHRIGGDLWHIRSLSDSNQHHDPEGLAASRGINEASWSFFGQVWASGLALAEELMILPVDGRRILELGCGLALGGMVAHRRHADVLASDIHPLCGAFLARNLTLNALPPMAYADVDWRGANPALGRFDVLVASDVLYEREHPDELSRFIDQHMVGEAVVVVVDPGRRQHTAFSRHMSEAGFDVVITRPDPATRLRVLTCRRGTASAVA